MPINPRDYGKRTREYLGFKDHLMESRRESKRKRFIRKLEAGYKNKPVILAEGDSWFEYPMAEDLLMALGEDYAILSLAKAGDSFAEVEDREELSPTLKNPPKINGKKKEFDIVMLSLGGNEVMGRIEEFTLGNKPGRADEDYLLRDKLKVMIEKVRGKYDTMIGRILNEGEQHVIIHGYDYPDPRFPPERDASLTGAQWIGPPLLRKHKIESLPTYRAVVNEMLDEFNKMLAQLAGEQKFGGRVRYVNLRGTIGKRNKLKRPDDLLWADEIHATTDGYKRLAKKFVPVIDAAWNAKHTS